MADLVQIGEAWVDPDRVEIVMLGRDGAATTLVLYLAGRESPLRVRCPGDAAAAAAGRFAEHLNGARSQPEDRQASQSGGNTVAERSEQ